MDFNTFYFTENDKTETNEFKSWFGNSKVVDEQGNPLIVYHGTSKKFSVFKLPSSKQKIKSSLGKFGFYFTGDSKLASSFGRINWSKENSKFKNGASVFPVYLSIKKPYIMDIYEFIKISNELGGDVDSRRNDLIKNGYDGIIIKKPTSGYWASSMVMDEFPTDQFVAFEPNQIKSATGNKGTFNPNSDNINEAYNDIVLY
jgi:hypothetical protein